jgi:hypothetical protein
MTAISRRIAGFVFLFVTAAFSTAHAQGVSLTPPALLHAKTVFISNAGSDSGLFPHPFSGTEARGYTTFYADMQAWGKYQIVDDPAKADLVLELQLLAPNGPTNANKYEGASDPLPMFRLVIYDRRTHYALWALSESIEPANLQKTHDHNLDMALDALMDDLKGVMIPTP